MGGGGRETPPPLQQQHDDSEGGPTSTDLPPLPPSPNHSSPRGRVEATTAIAAHMDLVPLAAAADAAAAGEEDVSWDVRGRQRRRRRTLATRTPQRLVSLFVPPSSSSSSSSSSLMHHSALEGQLPPEIQSGAVAACPPLLAFQQLVVVATVDGRLCFYDLSSPPTVKSHGTSSTSPNLQSNPPPPHAAHPHGRVAPSLVTHLQGGPVLSVVAMCAIPNTTPSSISSTSSSASRQATRMGHIMVLLSHGEVQVLRIRQSQSPDEEAPPQNTTSQTTPLTMQSLEVRVEHSFSTHVSSAATCMACHENPPRDPSVSSDTPIPSNMSIWVGHSCGTLTEHEWNHSPRTDPNDDTATQPNEMLLWRGTLLAPIQSIAVMVLQNNNTGTETTKQMTWLAVGRSVVPTPGMTAVTEAVAASVEFLDVQAIQQQYHQHPSNTNHLESISSSPKMTTTTTLDLTEHCLWPAAGMELRVDTASHETDYTLTPFTSASSASTTLQMAAHGCHTLIGVMEGDTRGMSSFAGALSDGTVAVCHATADNVIIPNNNNNTNGQEDGTVWGVMDDRNQVVLPQECIGMGSFVLQESWQHGRGRHIIACCLRGGTVFLLPVASPPKQNSNGDMEDCIPNNDDDTMTVYPYSTEWDNSNSNSMIQEGGDEPNNDDIRQEKGGALDEQMVRYVQGFAAGDMQLSHALLEPFHPPEDSFVQSHLNPTTTSTTTTTTATSTLPILAFAWLDGVVDIYTCGLLSWSPPSMIGTLEPINHKEGTVMHALVENGAMAELIQWLLSMEPEERATIPVPAEDGGDGSSFLYELAWNECQAYGDPKDGTISVETIVQHLSSSFSQQQDSRFHLDNSSKPLLPHLQHFTRMTLGLDESIL